MIRVRILLIVVTAWFAQAQASFASPFCLPPAAADAGMMRAAPEECLFYLGWNGAGKPDANSENQTDQLLAESEIQSFISQIDSQVTALVQQALRGNPPLAPFADDLPALVKGVLTRPVALYVSKVAFGPMGPDVSAGLVINTGDQQATFAKVVAQLETMAMTRMPPGTKLEEVTVAGAKLHRAPPQPGAPVVVWGFKDNYFLVSVGADAGQGLVGRLAAGAPAAWLTKLHGQAAVARPGRTWYLNVAGILETARPFMTDSKIGATLDAVGLQGVTNISSVSGFDGTGMTSKTLIATTGEPKGLFAAVAGKPLAAADLQRVPKDATFAVAGRLDLADLVRRVMDAAAKIDPAAGDQAKRQFGELDGQLGFDLSDDLLAALGDVWCAYTTPAKATEKNPAQVGNFTVSVTVRDRRRLDKSYPAIVKLLQQAAADSDGAWTVKQSTFRGNQVYYVPLKLPQQAASNSPLPLNFDASTAGLTPCWCLTTDRLVISSTPQGLKDFLTRESDSESLAARSEVAGWFKGSDGPSVITYSDTVAGLRTLYPTVQALLPVASIGLASQGVNFQIPPLPALSTLERHARPSIFLVQRNANGLLLESHETIPVINTRSLATTGIGAALLLPAVGNARQAATRAQSTNNLKEIGLGMHTFAATHKWFPAAAGCDQQGKPLLSWRVYLLPFFGQQELYNSFHMDEPWDSPHNKTLIARMPSVYRNPNLPSANEGKTNYLAVADDKAAIQPKKGTALAEITDGTSNTILVVEVAADKAVIWTKPEDWTPSPHNPFDGLFRYPPNLFMALFADGSVQTIADTTDANSFKAMLTRNAGDVVNFGGN
ncbi:MAG TPA: DUF1559 domain-containing protein [Pirellulales bacterium]|nr:DUF1559 domain-containing protein [Pirellulales bacterium]